MHFDHLPSLIASLAGSAVGSFVLLVAIDNALGVALAIKQHSFDAHALPSFLESQFGTQKAAALVGLGISAAVAALMGNQDLKAAVLSAITLGAASLTVAVGSDCKDKLRALAGL